MLRKDVQQQEGPAVLTHRAGVQRGAAYGGKVIRKALQDLPKDLSIPWGFGEWHKC